MNINVLYPGPVSLDTMNDFHDSKKLHLYLLICILKCVTENTEAISINNRCE